MKRHETPLRRVNPSGKTVWVARYTGRDGKRRSAGTFALKREAQAAIDTAYDDDGAGRINTRTIGHYIQHAWFQRHPRTERTTECYEVRLRAVMDVKVEGRKVRDWPLGEFRRRQASQLLDVLLREQKRAAKGAKGIMLVLSAMYSDAIEDGDHLEANPFFGIRVRAADRRVQKPARKAVVVGWEDMRRFARACGPYEPMVRVLSDCGLRIGEAFPLERGDVRGEWLEVRKTAWRGRVIQGTKTDHGEPYAGRAVPLGPSLAAMLAEIPPRIDTPLLFPAMHGGMWRDRRWYDLVWYPAQRATGLNIRPHDMRHSWVSLMRAAGVDPSWLASVSGHTESTATQIYTHATSDPAHAEHARAVLG